MLSELNKIMFLFRYFILRVFRATRVGLVVPRKKRVIASVIHLVSSGFDYYKFVM
jgi:hypothetical protein